MNSSNGPSVGTAQPKATADKVKPINPNLPLDPKEVEGAPDRLRKAHHRIESYAHDTEAWGVFIRGAQKKNIAEARSLYEKVVDTFPSCGKFWKVYIEHEMKAFCFEKVEKLFQRCLIKVLSIDLWRLYLLYVKETKGKLPTFREKMAQAYDFALEKIGQDYMSFPIWKEYVAFLKSVEAVGSYAENQRIAAVRKVYQKGIVTPMWNIEVLWKEYCAYETSVSPIIAKKMIDERSRDHMNSRRVAREYESVTKGLNKNKPAEPPTTSSEELRQVELWRTYIAWEKTNPLRSEDHTLITKRVMFAYEQCLLCLGHYPGVWIEAAGYLEHWSKILIEKGDPNAGKTFAEEASGTFDRAVNGILKGNLLVHFAYADFEEGRMKFEKSHSIYKKYLATPAVDPTLCYIQYMRFTRRAEGVKAARQIFKLAREDDRSNYHIFTAAALMEYSCSKDKTVAFKIFELGLKKYGHNLDYVLTYIDYMTKLNEDNNTRVLFERIISSNQIPAEQTAEIWRRFVEFESEIGDLLVISKVEKRRSAALEQIKENQGKANSLVIDRYKYLDLYPCSASEMRTMGYKDTPRAGTCAFGSADKMASKDQEDVAGAKLKDVALPDVAQLIPFKPSRNAPPGAHPVPGGVFPPPPAASFLLARLPPPTSFHGPFVKVDKLMESIRQVDLDQARQRLYDDGDMLSEGDIKMEHGKGRSGGSKKRKVGPGGEESDDESAPPIHDIYRQRQQKKAK